MSDDVRLDELKPGDRLTGFRWWGCVPERAVRTVKCTHDGELFVRCKEGAHYLDGQLRDDGTLANVRRAP